MKEWFNNLKVGTKLTLGFLIVAVITVVIGIIGVLSLNKVGRSYSVAYLDSVEALQHIQGISSSFQEVRANLFEMTLADDKAYKESCIDSINNHEETIKYNLEEYKKILENYSNEEVSTEIKLLEDLEIALIAFNTESNDIMNGIAMSSNRRSEAFKMMSDGSKLHTLSQAMEAAITALVDYNNTYTADQIKNNKNLVFTANITMIIFILIGIIVAVTIGLIISRNISNRINKVVEVANKLSDGDFNINITDHSNDEIGSLSKSFEKMSDTLIFIISDFSYILDELANANFTVKSKDANKYVGNYFEVVDSIRKMITMLKETLVQINTAAEQVSTGSSQVSSGAQALAAGSTEQAASIQELSASIEKIAELIINSSAIVYDSANHVQQTGRDVEEGNKQMAELTKAMEDIEQTSNQIANITKAIEDIAFQTNILALNAAIEAARAGNAGKGFAVVADEVRTLAAKSGEAAKQTTQLINASVEAVSNGTAITARTAQILQEVGVSASKVVGNFDNIKESSSEQTVAIEQIKQGISQISGVVQLNAANAEENSATSEEMSAQAVTLRHEVEKFKLR